MKIDLFDVVFQNANAVHYAGDRVIGEVYVNLRATADIYGIFIDFKGKAKCGWNKSNDDSNKKYEAEEVYFGKRVQLVGSPTGGTTTEITGGRHRYSFSMLLPSSLPSSFEGKKGYVRYFCKVTIDRPRRAAKTAKRPFTVIHHLDLNSIRNSSCPIIREQEMVVETCCCCSPGLVVGKLSLNKTGYVPGEPVLYNIDVWNRSDSTVTRLDLELRQFVTYTGYSSSIFSNGNPKHHIKMEEFTLFSNMCRIRASTEEHLNNRRAVIPSLPPSELQGCAIIDIKYYIVLKVNIGWNSLTITHPIIIGTIPSQVTTNTLARPGPSTSLMSPAVMPPPYTEPPPSYEESIFGRRPEIEDDDDEDGDGSATWAPSYPFYNWDQPPPSPPLGAPITMQPTSSTFPSEPPPPYCR